MEPTTTHIERRGERGRAGVERDEVNEVMASWEWSRSAVGEPESWPATLQTMVRVLLGSRFSMWMGWGPDLAFFYNDAYRVDTLGVKHPWALGRPAREVWAEIWDEIGPRIERVLETGEATWDEGLLLFLERSGFREETYHTFSYSPIRDASGETAGMLCVVSEDTDRVIGERRMTALRDLGTRLGTTQSEPELFDAVGSCLASCALDLPFSLLYLVDDDRVARLVATSGLDAHHPGAPPSMPVGDDVWPLDEVLRGNPVVVDDLATRFAPEVLPSGVWDDPPSAAIIVPLAHQGQATSAGFLVAGLNPYRPVDESYRGFVTLFAGQVAAGIANARALEAERRRSDALAEIDRAKTEFFSNVSHELRTPLTLIAGPASDSLADLDEPLPPAQRQRLELIDRNAGRLRRLVNDLLDFARIEGGGLEPQRQPADLSALTRDITTSFADAIERAHLELVVDCPPSTTTAHVDVEMWEKIVLNLLSNALKFTLEGSITVTMREDEQHAVLTVSDTGVGIPPDEVPLLFQRFHRVRWARGRSHEGTGVGLALVAELAGLHGGSATASSVEGVGSTFTVAIPFGVADPRSRAIDANDSSRAARVEEALQWTAAPAAVGGVERTRDGSVLVVDDNADLRDHIARILAPFWNVRVAGDGREALAAVRAEHPDLVLTDVMMPELDGFELLAALRSDRSTATIPVILLSARAGEEASVGGLLAGADDYLVKPFSSLDLVARVRANLELARFRNEESSRRRALVESLDEAVIVSDPAGTVVEANPAFERLLGYDHLATPYALPHPWWPTADEDPVARSQIDTAAARALAGEPGRATLPLWHADGRRMFVDASFSPMSDQHGASIVVSLRDVTTEVVTADRQSAVARLGVALARATDRRAVGEAALEDLHTLFGARFVAVLLGDLTAPAVLASSAGIDSAERDWSAEVGAEIARHRLITGNGALSLTPRHALVTTVSDGEQPATVWIELDPPRPVEADELALFRLVCQYLAQALHRARLYDEQVEVATAMQRSILGPTLTPPGVAVRYVPAVRPLEVGGDWYDVIELADDAFGIIVGDCVGKGLEAATVMGQLRSAARALFLTNPDPATVLGSLDAFARQLPGAECATAVCAVVDRRAGVVRYSSAGHVPGVVVHEDGRREVLDGARSAPLASLSTERTDSEARLPPGSIAVFFTDGLIERRGEELGIGIERLGAALVPIRAGRPEEVADRVLADLVPAAGPRDDIALVVYSPPPLGGFSMAIESHPEELRRLRAALRSWLDGLGLAGDVLDDILLASAEAAANAVEHAYGPGGRGTVQVSAGVAGPTLTVEVSDAGRWRPARNDDVTRGRGLLIMRSVMDDVTVAAGAGGTTVELVRRLDVSPT
jgi:PAS domain S-box-containing protein